LELDATVIECKVELWSWWIQHEDAIVNGLTGVGHMQFELANF
jgi:hypothetical protein